MTEGRGLIHPDMRGSYGCSVFGSLLVFGAPGLLLLAWPAWLALRGAPAEELGKASVPGFIGLVLVVLWRVLGRSARWYRRCSRVQRERKARPMRIHLVRNERGGLFLELHSLGDLPMNEVQVRVQAEVPSWDPAELEGQTVSVHIDERDVQGPVVVQAPRGLLWSAPMSRRQNRVEGRLV